MTKREKIIFPSTSDKILIAFALQITKNGRVKGNNPRWNFTERPLKWPKLMANQTAVRQRLPKFANVRLSCGTIILALTVLWSTIFDHTLYMLTYFSSITSRRNFRRVINYLCYVNNVLLLALRQFPRLKNIVKPG